MTSGDDNDPEGGIDWFRNARRRSETPAEAERRAWENRPSVVFEGIGLVLAIALAIAFLANLGLELLHIN